MHNGKGQANATYELEAIMSSNELHITKVSWRGCTELPPVTTTGQHFKVVFDALQTNVSSCTSVRLLATYPRAGSRRNAALPS